MWGLSTAQKERDQDRDRDGAEQRSPELHPVGPRGRSLERATQGTWSRRGVEPPPPTATGKTRGVLAEAEPGLRRGRAGFFSSQLQTFHGDAWQSEMQTPGSTR